MKRLLQVIRRRSKELAWVMALSAAPLLAAEQSGNRSSPLSDEDISQAIYQELKTDPLIPVQGINIRTEDGKAILSGQVRDLATRQRAEIMASTVRGVQTVVNQIVVRPDVKRTDQQLARDIERAWLLNAATESFELSAEVNNGVAILRGTVQSPTERRLARAVVSTVPGVRRINDQIEIQRLFARRLPSEIETEIQQMLQWDVHLDDARIDVEVQGSRVRLSGQVPSAAEKSRAISMAWVAGVTDVNAANLRVTDRVRAAKERLGQTTPRSDAELEQAVERAFLYNPVVKSFKINTQVNQGEATLTGTVSNHKAKRVASTLAKGIVGVKSVNNQIQVGRQNLSDAQIARRVRTALSLNAVVDGYEIDVQVNDGQVVLTGTVDTNLEKAYADDVASQIRGVRSVDNRLNVYSSYMPLTYDPYVWDYDRRDWAWYDYEPNRAAKSDAEIKEDIEDQLFWSPYVDEAQVNVTVHNGVAILTGQVESFDEKIAAGKNAIDGGAVNVNNQLVTTGEYDWPW